MSNLIRKLTDYHTQFGWRGFLLGLRTRLARRPFESWVQPKGFSHPIHLRFKTTDTPTMWKIFQEGEYDFPLAAPPTFIIDAGANVGFASLFFARKYPHARIVALEPERENFGLLQRNTRPYPNVVPMRAALWKQKATLNVVDPGLGPWAFQASDTAATLTGKVVDQVPAFTVDDLMQANSAAEVSLLKIDIEGGEKAVFENSSAWMPSVRAIMAELHDHITAGTSSVFSAVTQDFPIRIRRGETDFVARDRGQV